MIKKSFLKVALMGLMFVTASNIFSQDKYSVGILPFTYVNSAASLNDVTSIQEEVTNAFVKTKRFNIIDRTKMDALKKERELQKSEDFLDGSVVEQGKSIGAQFLISGHVSAISADELIVTDSKTKESLSGGWKAKLSVTLKVINVETGQVTNSSTIEPKTGSTLSQMTIGSITGPKTREAAIAKAIKDIQDEVDKFVEQNFPVSVAIVEFQGKKALVSGGSEIGMKKGSILAVYEVSMVEVNGKNLERKKEIGTLRVSKVEDENFSTCDIKSGEKEIKEKFESKANLKIQTKN
jgi:curli biogenesis system outer membrane secretion channel CsgG